MPAPYEYTYTPKTLAAGGLAIPVMGSPSLRDLIRPILSGRRYNVRTTDSELKVTVKDEPALTTQQETDLTDAVTAWDPDSVDLDAVKAAKIVEVNRHVAGRLKAGFTYGGKQLSLSREAQINWLGLATKSARLTYPYVIRTIDELDTYTITDAADAVALSDAAFDAVEAILADSRTVRTNVLAAVDAAAVDTAAASWLSGGAP